MELKSLKQSVLPSSSSAYDTADTMYLSDSRLNSDHLQIKTVSFSDHECKAFVWLIMWRVVMMCLMRLLVAFNPRTPLQTLTVWFSLHPLKQASQGELHTADFRPHPDTPRDVHAASLTSLRCCTAELLVGSRRRKQG